MTSGPPSTPPGWYDDGSGRQRWWDGTQWTDHYLDEQGGGGAAPAAGGSDPFDAPTRIGTPQADTPPADQTMLAGQGGAPGPAGYTPPAQTGPTPSAQPGAAPYGGGAPQAPAWQQPAGGYAAPGGAPGGYGAPGGPGGMPPGFIPPGTGGGNASQKRMILIVGGAIAAVLLLVIVFAVALGGGGPEKTVEDFFGAVQDGDCDGVDLLSEDFQDLGGVSKSDCEDQGGDDYFGNTDDECELEIRDVDEDGDKADVDYRVTGCDDSDNNERATAKLVKEDGDWRIDGFE